MHKVPAYRKIYYDLKNNIFQGIYPYSSRIPTEKELAATYKVSRITTKRAVDELASEGWVRRYPGKGSYVVYDSANTNNLVIGVIFTFSPNHGLKDYLAGISKKLLDSPYSIKIFYTNQPRFSFTELFTAINQGQLSGIILHAPLPQNFLGHVAQLFYKKFPIVLLNQKIEGLPVSTVTSQNFSGGYQAARYAIEKGHQYIHFVTDTANYDDSIVNQRYFGYLKALTDNYLTPPLSPYISEVNHISKNKALMKKYLLQWKLAGISCLIFENDILAIAFLSVANELNWSLPEHMSFIGFDNIPLSQLVSPKLTTIQQNFFDLGFQAATNLLEQIKPFKENEQNIKYIYELPVELIERSSVSIIHKK